jgi:hypothetical protein
MKSLRRKISLLEKVVGCEREHPHPEELYQQIYSQLEKKYDRISNRFPELNSIWHSIPYPESEQLTEEEIELMKMFVGRDIDVIFSYLERESKLDLDILRLVKDGETTPLPTFRKNGEIIFRNPVPRIGKKRATTNKEGLVQVWTRPEINHKYKKHTPSSRIPASKYFADVNRDCIELIAFNQGLGIVKNGNQITRCLLYLAFNQNIGYVDSKPNSPKTNLVRLQVDRSPKSKGYFCSIHGNPISENELRRSCLDKTQIEKIISNPYKLVK